MNTPGSESSLPPEMLRQLDEVRVRRRRVQIQTGLLLGAALLLAGMLAAMTVDWLVVLRDPRLRWIFTLAALACGLAGFLRWGLLPLLRPPSLDALAREVDRRHPFLQERYLTLAEFAHNADAPEIRGSSAMIARVAAQAATLSTKVQPMSVISRAGLVFAAKCFAALAVVFLLLFALDFQRAAILCERFWRPGADISLTRVEAKTGDVLIGKGEPVTLEVVASGKPASSATIHLRSPPGRDDEVVMRHNEASGSGFVYTQNSVMDSFEYQARAGDGQTAWHRVTVVDRPRIAQLELKITAPAYSHLPMVSESTLPHMVRALEGSRMELSIQADQPLASLVLQLDDGKTLPLAESPDHTYRFTATLTNSFTFQPILTNPRQMENLDKTACEVVVYPDEPPTVRVLTPSDQVTAGSSEKVNINFEARDDFGIAHAELDVSVKGESNQVAKVIPIPLEGAEQDAKLVRKQVELDLSQFNLQQGDELTYVVRVTDTKSNPALSSEPPPGNRNVAGNQPPPGGQNNTSTNGGGSSARNSNANQATNGMGELASRTQTPATGQNQNGGRNQPQNQANQNPTPNNGQNSQSNQGQNQNSQPDQPGQNPDLGQNQNQNGDQNQNGAENQNQNQAQNQNGNQSPNGKQDQADNQGQNQNGNQEQNQNGNQNQNQNQNSQSAQNNQSTNSPSQQPSGGGQPPPDSMSRRTLDVGGQTASAQPQTIKVDDWGGSFEGQQREKQEIAIDAVIKQLDQLLAKAQDGSDATLSARKAAAKLENTQMAPLASAQDNLRQADVAVDDLRAKSDGTPYAFIGLQMRDIRDTHVSPARDELGGVTGEASRQTNDVHDLEQASFHIMAARRMLADLTRTYQDAKRDNKLQQATQEIAKMHQLFIEDTQALLNPKRSALNSQNHKMAEVSDDFADKLQKVLEEQKKILDELAKTLAEDPRMLRRFLAMQQLDSVTLRDQLTLQARREQQLARETAAWTNTAATNHAAFLQLQADDQAAEQIEVTELAVKLHENMFTWWPLDLPTNREDFAGDLSLAADAGRLAGEAVSPRDPTNSLAQARAALDKFRELYDHLPALETNDGGTNGLGTFVANRMQETGELITRESGWIKKVESLRAGDLAQAVEVDQHRLTVDTTTLEGKLDTLSVSLRRVSPAVAARVNELLVTMKLGVLSGESEAEDALKQPDIPEAAERQADTTNAFERAETEFDQMLQLMADLEDAAPPPTSPGQTPGLDDLLTMLKNEQKAAEQLGLSGRPINVSIMNDWMNPSSSASGSGGQAQASGRAAQQQARATQQQARNAQQQARNAGQRNRGDFNRNRNRGTPGRGRADADPNGDEGDPGDPAGAGPAAPVQSWNTLVSKLGDEIRQGRDNVPPEQYRQAIEHYFEQISETLPISAAPESAPAPAPGSAPAN